jgi:cyclopropane-fatty-acyl-phospholipid synthase
LADVKVGGTRPQDITIHNPRFYKRVLAQRELGLGESYMDGWWDANELDAFIAQMLSTDIKSQLKINARLVWHITGAKVTNKQTIRRAKSNADHHYAIGNDLYERMLDKRMVYSCGYWKDAKNLDDAQTAKLDLICRKLHLKKGMTLLDIGCGWGGFTEYAARNYGVTVTAIAPVAEQVQVVRERTKGLPVTVIQQDYRDVKGTFDRVVSIGMLEHAGLKNYETFFARCKELLNEDGLMLHHTIASNVSRVIINKWADKYIFPGGLCPSLLQLAQVFEGKLVVEDLQNIGPDYDKTLMAWFDNFKKHYPEISGTYDERFYRMWEYYLRSCAGAFRARDLQLYQIVLRKITPSPTYLGVR